MVTAKQIRAARGWLGLSQDDLAQLSGVAKRTIARIEQELSVPYERTLRDLQACFEGQGIEFLFEGSKGVGLRVHSKERGRGPKGRMIKSS